MCAIAPLPIFSKLSLSPRTCWARQDFTPSRRGAACAIDRGRRGCDIPSAASIRSVKGALAGSAGQSMFRGWGYLMETMTGPTIAEIDADLLTMSSRQLVFRYIDEIFSDYADRFASLPE